MECLAALAKITKAHFITLFLEWVGGGNQAFDPRKVYTCSRFVRSTKA